MSNFKIAVAQVPSIKADVTKNIEVHLNAIAKASVLDISYIVFPELSLTGYEPSKALTLAFSSDDRRLKPLIDSAIKNNIKIAVGAPLKSDGKPKIGLIIISETGEIETYEKMNLHPGEEKYFSNGSRYHSLTVESTVIANAICADTNNENHALSCFNLGASIYIAGVLIGKSGYVSDTKLMAEYAKRYNMLVAMANHNQPTGIWSPVGKSAIWSSSGLLACASEIQNALVVAEKNNAVWCAQVIEI
ncbi:carbon-nitrogen hydrolase family protein [Psychromonas sp.]|nr:carbon-nitrogen hydrolase family protein [Psychromonas sp.]